MKYNLSKQILLLILNPKDTKARNRQTVWYAKTFTYQYVFIYYEQQCHVTGVYLSMKCSPCTGSPCLMRTVSKMKVSRRRLISSSFFSLLGMWQKKGWPSIKSLISANSFSWSDWKVNQQPINESSKSWACFIADLNKTFDRDNSHQPPPII